MKITWTVRDKATGKSDSRTHELGVDDGPESLAYALRVVAGTIGTDPVTGYGAPAGEAYKHQPRLGDAFQHEAIITTNEGRVLASVQETADGGLLFTEV